MNIETAQALVDRIQYKDWTLRLAPFEEGGEHFYLQVRSADVCNVSGDKIEWGGRKWHISRFMTDGEVVLTALKAVLTAEEHEAREKFLFDGEMIFHPHPNVEVMKEFAKIPADVREDIREILAYI